MFMYVYGVNICSLCYMYVYGVNICSLCLCMYMGETSVHYVDVCIWCKHLFTMLYVCIWCKHLFTMFMYVYGGNICSLCRCMYMV